MECHKHNSLEDIMEIVLKFLYDEKFLLTNLKLMFGWNGVKTEYNIPGCVGKI